MNFFIEFQKDHLW